MSTVVSTRYVAPHWSHAAHLVRGMPMPLALVSMSNTAFRNGTFFVSSSTSAGTLRGSVGGLLLLCSRFPC